MQEVRTNSAWHTLLDLEARSGGPLHARLTEALREAIRSSRLPSGSALPPSRILAQDLGCSRWIVTEAYGQLVAEGYLEARVGSGTNVRTLAATSSDRVASVTQSEAPSITIDLGPGLPDLGAFPVRAWMTALRSAADRLSPGELGYPDRAGQRELRDVLAAYLVRVRGAAADRDNISICNGITDGIGRVCRTLRRSGFSAVAVEDPGWAPLRNAAIAAGLDIIYLPVDENGLCLEQLQANPAVRAVIVSPTHQFPSGVALSGERRASLLAWARRVNGLILEDDYDAEFRYDRRAISAMQGSDPSRVALFGSVSKTLSPAMRIGWMLTPRAQTDAIRASDAGVTGPSILDQLAFASLLQAGAYDRHLRRCRIRYRIRRDSLMTAFARHLPEARISGIAAGLHLVVQFEDQLDYPAVVRRAAAQGVRVVSLGGFRVHNSSKPDGLVVGYGNLADSALEEGVSLLAAILDETRSPGIESARPTADR